METTILTLRSGQRVAQVGEIREGEAFGEGDDRSSLWKRGGVGLRVVGDRRRAEEVILELSQRALDHLALEAGLGLFGRGACVQRGFRVEDPLLVDLESSAVRRLRAKRGAGASHEVRGIERDDDLLDEGDKGLDVCRRRHAGSCGQGGLPGVRSDGRPVVRFRMTGDDDAAQMRARQSGRVREAGRETRISLEARRTCARASPDRGSGEGFRNVGARYSQVAVFDDGKELEVRQGHEAEDSQYDLDRLGRREGRDASEDHGCREGAEEPRRLTGERGVESLEPSAACP